MKLSIALLIVGFILTMIGIFWWQDGLSGFIRDPSYEYSWASGVIWQGIAMVLSGYALTLGGIVRMIIKK